MCTDVHLATMHDSEFRITTFIDAMKKEKPDFIIELGDFCTPEPKYAGYFEIWNSFPGDKYHVIGNHEMDGGTSKDKAVAYRGMKNSYYSFDKNGFHFPFSLSQYFKASLWLCILFSSHECLGFALFSSSS